MPNTAAEPKRVRVAVAVLRDTKGQVLITRRSPAQHQGGLWEFPGGKIEAGETLGDALEREIAEELGVTVLSHNPLMTIEHDYPDKQVALHVCEVWEFSGEPRALEEQPMRWVRLEQLQEYPFPKANEPIVARLKTLEA